MPDPSEGFASGLMSGLQGGQALALGKEELQLNQLKIDQTKMAMKQQQAYLERLAKINNLHNTPGSTPSTPQDQARQMSDVLAQVFDAALSAGRTEEAAEMAEKSSKLAENASLIDMHEASAMKDRAGFTGHQMDWVLEASKDPKEAQRRWQISNALFGATFGMESKYAGMPYNEELVKGIRAQSITSAEEATLKEKAAQEANARSEIDRRTKLNKLTDEQIKIAQKREEFLGKQGAGGISKAQQALVDFRASTIKDVDVMLDKLAATEKDPTGVTGRYHDFAEWLKSFSKGWVGEKGKESTQFKEDMDNLLLKLPRAITSASYRNPDVQALVHDLADFRKIMTNKETAVAKLSAIRERLQDEQSAFESEQDSKRTGVLKYDDWLAQQEAALGAGGQ